MNDTDLKLNSFFTTNGKDIWALQSYCMSPTCELKNLLTNQIESFGMNGLTAKRFHKIEMPEAALKKEDIPDDINPTYEAMKADLTP